VKSTQYVGKWVPGTEELVLRPKPGASDFLVTALCLSAFCTIASASRAQVPVYEVTPVEHYQPALPDLVGRSPTDRKL
jgi:hypothetical protein